MGRAYQGDALAACGAPLGAIGLVKQGADLEVLRIHNLKLGRHRHGSVSSPFPYAPLGTACAGTRSPTSGDRSSQLIVFTRLPKTSTAAC